MDEVNYTNIAALLGRYGRLVVSLVVRAQGSVPRKAGARMLVLPDSRTLGTVGGGLFESLVVADALAALAHGESVCKKYDFREKGTTAESFGAICGGWAELFLEVVTVPDRLLIVGAGHCGRALAEAAHLLGDFEVLLADDRPEGSGEANLSSGIIRVRLASDLSDLPALVGPRTYVALVSRGADTDALALRRVIGMTVPYVGMMGSRRKSRTVMERLRADGVPEAHLARVHTPIGLEIGAATPAQIAIAVLAQIIAVRARLPKGTAAPLAEDSADNSPKVT